MDMRHANRGAFRGNNRERKDTMKKTKPPLLFNLKADAGSEFGNIELHLLETHDEGEIGAAGYSSFEGDVMRDFVVSCQWDTGRDQFTGDAYAFEVGYRDTHCTRLPKLERMVKFLRRIVRRLDKLDEQWGRPVDFPTYVRRVAAVLNIKEGAVWSRSTHEWHRMDLTAVDYWIRSTIEATRPVDHSATA